MCVTKCPALGRWINPFSWTLNVFTFSPDMCVELAHVFPSMGSRRLVTMLTYLAPLMVQSEKQALLPCSLYAFFLILLFSNADFRSSAVFHFFYTATRLLYASTPFLLSSPSLCSWSPWTLPLIALPQTWSLSVSLSLWVKQPFAQSSTLRCGALIRNNHCLHQIYSGCILH